MDGFGDSVEPPRVGEQYQAEIPPLIPECDRLQLINRPNDMEDVPYTLLWELPIPIVWKADHAENVNAIVELENTEESQITAIKNHPPPNEPLDIVSGEGKEIGGSSNLQLTVGGDNVDVDMVIAQESQITVFQAKKGRSPIPWSSAESWGDIESASFVLSLYIFGKNFNLVKRFVKSKPMGEILSYYYGKFYKSEEHERWSKCRKTKNRRCIHKQKIFTGPRQQELFSRLFPLVSVECKKKVLEISKKFGDGKMPFEDYVFTLEDTVGIAKLVEAIGIGKGKQDLTGMAAEPVKSIPAIRARREVPTGKDWTSLSYEEIIKCLNGDIRLSKAKSTDLFWDAVWPRLLARGWQSLKREDIGASSLNSSIVFLTPAVKDFSQSRFVKGKHYYDSIADVLRKVASDPKIIKLKTDKANGSQHKEENGSEQPIEQDQEVLSNQRKLKQRNSNSSQDLMTFTIVDSSLFCGEGQFKVTQLKSLPTEATSNSTRCSLSNYPEQDSSEESAAEETKASKPVEGMNDRASKLNTRMPDSIDLNILAADNHDSQSTSLRNAKQAEKRVKSGKLNCPGPARKQPVLTACDRRESSYSIENVVKDSKRDEVESKIRSNYPDVSEFMVLQVGSSQNLSSLSSAELIPADSNKRTFTENGLGAGAELSSESLQSRALFDLNLPYICPDLAAAEPSIMDNSFAITPSLILETSQQLPTPKQPDDKASTEQQPLMNSRRQSTRSRPLTTKALEALQYGFYPTKKKRKTPEASQSNANTRSSRRVRARTGITASNDTSGNDITNFQMEVSSNGADSSNTNMVSDSHV